MYPVVRAGARFEIPAAITYVAGAASAASFLLIAGVDVLRGLGLGRVPKGRRL